MGFFSASARTLGLIVLGAVSSGASQAAERLHMPFDCRSDGRRVHLEPSYDRTYEVIGPREREIYSACSPADPGRCRSWFVHRFDLDCNGARVAWLDVAAAAARYYRRDAWVQDGRYHMRMGPQSAFDRPSFPRRRWQRRYYPEESDGLGPDRDYPNGSARVVALPPGYAPSQGIPISFSGAEPGGVVKADGIGEAGGMDEPAPPPLADAARARAPAPETIPALPERKAATRVAAARETAPADAGKVASKAGGAAESIGATGSVGESSSAEGGAVTATIINAPPSAAGRPPASAAAAASAKDGSPATETSAAPAATTVARAAETEGTAGTSAGAEPNAPTETTALPSASAPEPESAAAPMRIAAAAAFVLASLAAFGLWRSRRRRVPAPPAHRDFASITLEGGTQGTALALGPVAEGPRAPQAEIRSLEEGELSGEVPVPATYAEALSVLGASPDASITAIKKIVDGLRQSWHPDLARSEADRIHRERRLRQVNVAWDLVSQRRTAA